MQTGRCTVTLTPLAFVFPDEVRGRGFVTRRAVPLIDVSVWPCSPASGLHSTPFNRLVGTHDRQRTRLLGPRRVHPHVGAAVRDRRRTHASHLPSSFGP